MLASQERRKATTAIPEVVMVQILCKVEDVSNDQRNSTAQDGLLQGNAYLG